MLASRYCGFTSTTSPSVALKGIFVAVDLDHVVARRRRRHLEVRALRAIRV
jgi:hypothetical protein